DDHVRQGGKQAALALLARQAIDRADPVEAQRRHGLLDLLVALIVDRATRLDPIALTGVIDASARYPLVLDIVLQEQVEFPERALEAVARDPLLEGHQ